MIASYGDVPEIRRRSIGRLVSRRVQALRQIDGWPVQVAAAGVVRRDGTIETHGDAERVVRLASVSKPVGALATMVAAEEGVVDLDEPAGPPGSTVRHLLAHASGLPPQGLEPMAPPGRRRIYSNSGFAVLASQLERSAEMAFADYVRAAVCVPLRIGLDPSGDPGSGMHSSLLDLLAVANELLRPTLVAPETRDEMLAVQFPGLTGVLPDFGRFEPLDWGLGVQRNTRPPTWMGTRTSPGAVGHFGRSGTFVWVDPAHGVALGALTDRTFGAWAKEAWPALSDAVLAELTGG
jgi:CubicO group peptidase (beta-lactamase class C family)